MDPKKHAEWLAKRVLEYGYWSDWQALVAYYGKPRLAVIVTGIRSLTPRTFAFCRAWFQLPASDFRCSNTPQMIVEGIKIDCLRHAYPVLDVHTTLDSVRMWSVADVSAMKLNAITNRGSKKDFFDLAMLLKHNSLQELLDLFCRKYAVSNRFMVIRSLAWFDDAENEPDPIDLCGANWPGVKTTITGALSQLG